MTVLGLGLVPDLNARHRERRRPQPQELSLVEQVRQATFRKYRLATVCGAILGGFVPIASYVLAHHEVAARPHLWVLVAGALLFSALSVFDFGRLAFQSGAKALGFVVLIEGVMVWSATPWLARAALALLVAINAVATGTNLALDQGSRSQGAE